LRVRGLYRCLGLKLHIEANLAGADGVLSVSASILTGTVLVRFSPELEMSAVIAQVELLIRVTPAMPVVADDHPIGEHAAGVRTPSWHTLTVRQVAARFSSSSVRGLPHDVGADRLRRAGPNALPSRPTRSGLLAFLDQFKSLPVALLLGSAALSVATGGVGDAVAIVAVVLLNAAIGFFTERQAESRIAALLSDGRSTAVVYRGGDLYNCQAKTSSRATCCSCSVDRLSWPTLASSALTRSASMSPD
jgi:Ca2+-transporting ATPase